MILTIKKAGATTNEEKLSRCSTQRTCAAAAAAALTVLGYLTAGLELTRLVRRVLEYHVGFLVLEVAQADEDDVGRVDPHLLAQLAAYVAQSLLVVEAHGLEAAVAQHLNHLGVRYTRTRTRND